MNKKGAEWGFVEVAKWFLGFLIVFIMFVIFIYNLFPEARNAILGIGSRFLPEEKAPEFLAQPRVPPEFEEYFDNLANKITNVIKNVGDKNFCTIEIGKVPKAKGISIGFHNDKIQIEKNDLRYSTPAEKTVVIEGFKPCAVKGNSATKFYSCFINNPSTCPAAYNSGTVDIGIVHKGEDVYESGDTTIDEDSKIAPFLFKLDKNHLCIIYLDGFDFDFNFDYDKCTNKYDVIDDECVGRLRKQYKEC